MSPTDTDTTPNPNPPPYTTAPPPPQDNPWNPPTPTTELYRHFKSFCALENAARTSRGETPFCNTSGRERAFEKLLRLSNGTEKREWRVDCRPEHDAWGAQKSWYEVNGWTGEEGKVSGEEGEWVDVDGEGKRKDSKDVNGGWRKLVGRFAGKDGRGGGSGDVGMRGGAGGEGHLDGSGREGERENSCAHIEDVSLMDG